MSMNDYAMSIAEKILIGGENGNISILICTRGRTTRRFMIS